MSAWTAVLTDFLLARIAEDEAVARDFIAEGPWQQWASVDMSGPTRDDEYAGLNIGAARVLAECAAKRRIVERQADILSSPDLYDRSAMVNAREVLESLGAVYADHPDYRDEWRP